MAQVTHVPSTGGPSATNQLLKANIRAHDQYHDLHHDQSAIDSRQHSPNDRLPIQKKGVQSQSGGINHIQNGVQESTKDVRQPLNGVLHSVESPQLPIKIANELTEALLDNHLYSDKINSDQLDSDNKFDSGKIISDKHGSGHQIRPASEHPKHQVSKQFPEPCSSSDTSTEDISNVSTITDISNDSADTPDTADTDVSDADSDEIRDTSPPPSYQEAMLEALDAVNHNINQHTDFVGIPNVINSIPNLANPGSMLNDDEVPSYEETVNTPFLSQKSVLSNAFGSQVGNQFGSQVGNQFGSQVGNQFGSPKGTINSGHGNSLGNPLQNISMKSINSVHLNNNGIANSPLLHNASNNLPSSYNNSRKTSIAHTNNDNVSVHTYVHSECHPDYHSEFQDYASAFSSGIHTPLQSHVGAPTLHSYAPDGGYGWIICLASFLIMIILDGMLFSFGVFFLDLLEYFQEGKGKTAWVGSTLMGTHLIVGPFTSALVNLWGCRIVAMVGAVIATVAFALSICAPSIEILIFTYGVLGGIGMSMIYIPAVLMVGFYFDKRRALANGIAASGSGVGTFLYAPLCRILQDHYGWRGGLLILAGLVFNCLALAALFKPLITKAPESERSEDSTTCTSDDNDEKPMLPSKISKQSLEKVDRVERDVSVIKKLHLANINRANGANQSLSAIPSHLNNERFSPLVTGSANNLAPVLPHSINTQEQCFLSMVAIPVGNSQIISQSHHNMRHRHYRSAAPERPLHRKDLFYSGSVYRINSTHTDIHHDIHHDDRPIGISEKGEKEKRRITFEEFVEGLRIIIGFSLLKKPLLLLTILMGVLWTTHASVLTILPNYATMSGVSKFRAGFLLSIIGVSNILGRLVAGFLADRLDCVKINMVALITGGLINLMIPFFTNYYVLASCATVFGLCMGTWTSLRPIVLVNLLGLDKLTNAFGLMAMFQGGAFCIGSPIAGMLFDYTQSFKIPFIIAGIAFIMSGLLCIPLRIMGNREHRKNPAGLDIVVS